MYAFGIWSVGAKNRAKLRRKCTLLVCEKIDTLRRVHRHDEKFSHLLHSNSSAGCNHTSTTLGGEEATRGQALDPSKRQPNGHATRLERERVLKLAGNSNCAQKEAVDRSGAPLHRALPQPETTPASNAPTTTEGEEATASAVGGRRTT